MSPYTLKVVSPINVITTSLLFLLSTALSPVVEAESVYLVRPDDPRAVHLDDESFPGFASGADITKALQGAINRAEESGKFGIVLIPSGQYYISDTIYIWRGVRVFGYGAHRPQIRLSANAAGFDGETPKYMFHFTSGRPDEGESIRDANPGTFYSAFSNIDISIEGGNSGAVGIRSHFAQHCFLSHVLFEIGEGLAGVDEVGNIIHNCDFKGGKYGIMTKKPAPSWPFVLADSSFSGQSEANIITQEAGMTVVRSRFEKAPYGFIISENRSEELVVEDCDFKDLDQAIVLVSEENNGRTQINITNSNGSDLGAIAHFRKSGNIAKTPDRRFHIAEFSHGLHLDGFGDEPEIETRFEFAEYESASFLVKPHRTLPSNDQWVNVVDLGAVGDGMFDNTQILRDAIAKHDTLYFPSGRYIISDTLELRSRTNLVGLSPITTQIAISDASPNFHPHGAPKAMILSARGGDAILQGVGIDPGGTNNRAVPLIWRAGENSLVDDVRFHGGHGTYTIHGESMGIYNNNRSGDSDRQRSWDSMPPSIWVTDNGGGTFQNIWTPSPFAHAGMLVENTTTPGRVYQMSSEHHLRNEVILRNVQNWSFYALQFEEESHEGRNTLPLRIEGCSDIVFNNTYIYRVSRTFTPYPYGVHIHDSSDLIFRGIHAYGPTKFTVDNTLYDSKSKRTIRSREIARLEISDEMPESRKLLSAEIKRLAEGFNHIDSPEIDDRGRLYFVDRHLKQVLCWDPSLETVNVVLDLPIEPAQILLDGQGDLLVFTRIGQVYKHELGRSQRELELIEPETFTRKEVARFAIPNTRWRDAHDFDRVATELKPYYFNHKDISVPSESSYVNAGTRSSYFNTFDLIRGYDLLLVEPGESVYISDEFAQKTWQFTLSSQGTLTDQTLFAEEGEAGAVETPNGEVLIAAGNLLVYSQDGTYIGTIEVPHRPTALHFDKNDPNLLYVLARSALYQLRLESVGL